MKFKPKGGVKMSKTEQIVKKELEKKAEPEKVDITTAKDSDIFAVCQENTHKYFESIEKSIPKYLQAIQGLQKESIEAYENILKASLALQYKFAKSFGAEFDFQKSCQNAAEETTVNLIRTRSIGDQVTLGIIDSYTDNIKAWNDSVKAFADVSISFFESWFSIFEIKRD